MKRCNKVLFLAVFFLSCSPQSNWQLTSITTGQKDFDSTRLSYSTEDRLAGMNLDFFCANGLVTAYLSTSGRCFSMENDAKALIHFKSETVEIPLTVHEGRMRVRLPDELTAKTTAALQDGEAVTIMIGSTAQTFQPDQFSIFFNKLTSGSNNFFDSFQGTLP